MICFRVFELIKKRDFYPHFLGKWTRLTLPPAAFFQSEVVRVLLVYNFTFIWPFHELILLL